MQCLNGGSETLFNMLDEKYRTQYGITKENAYSKINCLDIGDLEEEQLNNLDVEIKVKDMYVREKSANIRIYFVYGVIKANIVDINKEYNFIVEVDSANNTFAILPDNYVKDNNYDRIENLINYNVDFDEIVENDYNKFNFVNIDDSTIINDYLSNYKDILVENLEESYNLLSEQYRNERFETYEQYEQYVEENKRNLLSISFTKYKINDKEDGKEYICLDKNNNYYIFKENAIMDYEIYLDDYTIDSTEFKEKYNEANETNKVGLNVEKIIKALNKKDYNYIYKKLDKTFISNNFSTVDNFKVYMEEKYPSVYEVEYYQTKKENQTYIQPIDLIEKDTEEKISTNIIMQLKEGTDFVMSFEV